MYSITPLAGVETKFQVVNWSNDRLVNGFVKRSHGQLALCLTNPSASFPHPPLPLKLSCGCMSPSSSFIAFLLSHELLNNYMCASTGLLDLRSQTWPVAVLQKIRGHWLSVATALPKNTTQSAPESTVATGLMFPMPTCEWIVVHRPRPANVIPFATPSLVCPIQVPDRIVVSFPVQADAKGFLDLSDSANCWVKGACGNHFVCQHIQFIAAQLANWNASSINSMKIIHSPHSLLQRQWAPSKFQ